MIPPDDFDQLLPAFLDLPVYPPTVDLDERGRLRVRAEFGDFKGHVPYTPGEDLRFLDWSVLARTGHKMCRRFELVRHRRLSILADLSPSMRSREKGLRDLLRLFGFLGLHRLDSVELVTGEKGGTESRLFVGATDYERYRETVLSLSLDGGPPEIAPEEDRSLGRMLISDLQPEEAWRSRLAQLRQQGHAVLALFPRLPLEAGDDSTLWEGPSVLRDLAGGENLSVAMTPALYSNFLEEQEDWEIRTGALCKDLKHGFMAVDLPRPEHHADYEAWLPFLARRAETTRFTTSNPFSAH